MRFLNSIGIIKLTLAAIVASSTFFITSTERKLGEMLKKVSETVPAER